MNFGKKKLVVVEWEDAASNSGHYQKNDPETYGTVMCRTVGYLLNKDKHRVVLATEWFEDGGFRHTHSIPKGMVRKITILSEANNGRKN